MEFKVKRDFLYVFLINIVLAFLTCIFIPFITENTWFFVIIMAIAFTLLVLFNTAVIFSSCRVENSFLTFKAGLFKYEIELKNIVKVERAKNIYGSLCVSHDRVRILVNKDGKNKVYYVAVVNNDELVKVLEPKKAQPKVEATEKETEAKLLPKKKTTTTAKKTVAKKTTTAKKATTKKVASKTTTKKASSKKTTK